MADEVTGQEEDGDEAQEAREVILVLWAKDRGEDEANDQAQDRTHQVVGRQVVVRVHGTLDAELGGGQPGGGRRGLQLGQKRVIVVFRGWNELQELFLAHLLQGTCPVFGGVVAFLAAARPRANAFC